MFNNSMSENAALTKKTTDTASDQSWVGFLCKECGAPLAVHRSNNGSRAGERSTRGWRITCISCGVPDFYELGSAMIRIAAT
jgi:RNase P subunit RPR2